MIPPKPQLSDSIRRTYQFRRVNSNPHWKKDPTGDDSKHSLTKQLSKSHDQLHFSGTESKEQSPIVENEVYGHNSDGTRSKEWNRELEEGNFSIPAESLFDREARSNEDKRGHKDKQIQSVFQEAPAVPPHRAAPSDAAQFAPRNYSPPEPISEGTKAADGYDEFPDDASVDKQQYVGNDDHSTVNKHVKNVVPLCNELWAQPGSISEVPGREQGCVRSLDSLGAKKRTVVVENETVDRSERRNIFPNAIYESLYLAEEPKYGSDTVWSNGLVSPEVRVEHPVEDRRKSCPMFPFGSDEAENIQEKRSSTLDRSKSKPHADFNGKVLRYPDPKRPVPLPPGTSRKDFELNYSVERNDGALARMGTETLHDFRKKDDFGSGTIVGMNVDPPSLGNTEVPIDDDSRLFENEDQPAPVLPLKKKHSLKYKTNNVAHRDLSDTPENGLTRSSEPSSDGYATPSDGQPVSVSKDERDFHEDVESMPEASFYECPTKIISENHKSDNAADGSLGFEDDFSSMFPTMNHAPMDPFYDDEFFKVTQPAVPACSHEGQEPNQQSRKPRTTKQTVNGEPVSIGRDEELDSVVDEKTGRTMVAGPGRFFRPGQAVGPRSPIEFYQEDYHILMSQGYSKAQITRALVVAENNFTIARKILTEFASPGE